MDGIYACITTPKLTGPFSLKEKENTMLFSTYTTWILKLEISIAAFPAVAELVQALQDGERNHIFTSYNQSHNSLDYITAFYRRQTT